MGDWNRIGNSIIEVPMPEGSALKLSGRITGNVKCAYEDWLENTARKRLFRQRDKLDPAEFNEHLASLQAEIGANTFSWGGKAWLSSINQLPGVTKLVAILMHEADPGQDSSGGRVMELLQTGFTIARVADGWVVLDDKKVVGGPFSAESLAVEALEGYARDHRSVSQMVQAAVAQAREASPNFLSPPERGDW